MQASCWQFRLLCGCGGTTWGASPDGAHPGLHGKPLDAAIGQVPAPYRPGATMVDIFFDNTQSTIKTPFLAINYGTIQSLVVYENFSPKTKPSTQLIDATKLRINVRQHDSSWSAQLNF